MELPIKQFQTRGEEGYATLFAKAKHALPGAGSPWADGLRAEAFAAYAAQGLPHRRIEAWKYTDLRSKLTEPFPLARASGPELTERDVPAAIGPEMASLQAYRLVVAGGELRSSISDIAALEKAGAEIVSLTEALSQPPLWLKGALGKINAQSSDSVIALNLALMTGGVGLKLRAGASLDRPVHLIHLDAPERASIVTRNVILVQEGASLELIESYAGRSNHVVQRNVVTELSVGAKGSVKHVKLQREEQETFHLGTWLVDLAADARYQAFQFSTGASLSRNQIYAALNGEGSSLDVSGALMMRDQQHCDTTLVIEHRVPRCTSRELFKAVLNGEARGVFQGKIVVSPGAQKTDGKQMAQALLLSETAEFDSKPELEIFADDVVCGHGATSGQIDEDLLFYLESRGVPPEAARALLVQAFVGEAVERIENETVREAFDAAAADWLGVRFD